jgi:site-specific DNA recombinase
VIGNGRGGSGAPRLDPALVTAIARAHQWFEDLVSGRAGSLVEIAKAEGVTDRYVGQLLPLAFPTLNVVSLVLAGTQPVHLTTEMLMKRTDLPLDWEEQRALLGFNGHLRVPTPEGCSDRSAS